ncbi:MAG: DUF5915 domain-containing protein, partial [Myxococcota bacterium]|nr:DUF5915 domain-containing protein [Myxococcota bacterium]
RSELDRWLLSMLQSLVKEVNTQMEGYYLYNVIPPVLDFIDHMTNWYIRRSRRRFWRSVAEEDAKKDKAAAYATLYEVLVRFSQVLAPVLPFLSEGIYQHLVVEQGMVSDGKDSVHLCDYPEVEEAYIDTELEQQVSLSRQVVRMGRALREKHKLKTRQPLKAVTIVHHDVSIRNSIEKQSTLIAEELNVKSVHILATDADLTDITLKANFKRLGRRFGRQMKEAAQEIERLTRADWEVLQNGGRLEILGQEIEAEDLLLRREPKADVLIETEDALLLALDAELTEELIAEGYARDLIRNIQKLRKDSGFDVSDRISVELFAQDEGLRRALEVHRSYIAAETLCDRYAIHEQAGGGHQIDIASFSLGISIAR